LEKTAAKSELKKGKSFPSPASPGLGRKNLFVLGVYAVCMLNVRRKEKRERKVLMEELTKKLITQKRPSLINYSLFSHAIAWPKSSNLKMFTSRIELNLD
jgi:hypothetical protein